MYLDRENIYKHLEEIIETQRRIENKLDRLSTIRNCLDEEQLLDNQDLLMITKLSPRTLQRYRKRGILPYVNKDGKNLSANSFETRFNHEITARGNNNPRESISSDCNNYTEDNSVGGLFNLLSMETLGNDPDEERFRRLIQRKKKKKLRRKL